MVEVEDASSQKTWEKLKQVQPNLVQQPELTNIEVLTVQTFLL